MNKPVVLVISDDKEKLVGMKQVLKENYKGVFVRDEDSAKRYLEKHNVEFVVRDGETE